MGKDGSGGEMAGDFGLQVSVTWPHAKTAETRGENAGQGGYSQRFFQTIKDKVMHGWIRLLSEKLEIGDEGTRTKRNHRAGCGGRTRARGKKASRRILSVQT